MYAVQASVSLSSNKDNTLLYRQLPTFYLDPTVQGITNREHAVQIAKDILNPFKEPNRIVHVTAFEFCEQEITKELVATIKETMNVQPDGGRSSCGDPVAADGRPSTPGTALGGAC